MHASQNSKAGHACQLPEAGRAAQVVFFNSRGQSRGVIQAARQAQVQHLHVVHVKGDPLDQLDMADKLDIATCALSSGLGAGII